MGTAQLQIYGMKLEMMNQLSTLGMAPTLYRRNTILIEAGDDTNGMATVFVGTITNAWADFGGAPDAPFRVEAHTGLIEAVSNMPPSSYQGAASVAVVMQSLATKMGLSFQNSGVTVVLSNAYFSGSPRNQVLACAEAAGIEWIIDDTTLAIWPRGQSRGGAVPLISPETGMLGYPSYTSKGVALRTVFNPSIGFGQQIEVKSDLTPACGRWVVYTLAHELEALVPNGRWFSAIDAARVGLGPIVQ